MWIYLRGYPNMIAMNHCSDSLGDCDVELFRNEEGNVCLICANKGKIVHDLRVASPDFLSSTQHSVLPFLSFSLVRRPRRDDDRCDGLEKAETDRANDRSVPFVLSILRLEVKARTLPPSHSTTLLFWNPPLTSAAQ